MTGGSRHEETRSVRSARSSVGAKRLGILALGVCTLLMVRPPPAHAQLQSGNLYGRVTDNQGEPLPGSTVTLTQGSSRQVQVTNAQGEFRFLGLTPGQYSLKSELEGFSTVDYPNVAIRIGRNTTIEVGLTPAVEEVITVTSESPLLDERKISTGTTVSQKELDKIPSARDPWAVLQTVPGVQTDRINVGGNESGQQSNYVGPGSDGDEAVWAVDGVVITDMAAEGSSPTYYDFDAFEEFQASTGGTDLSLATGGVTLNLVTKRGTNEWRFSGRYLMTDSDWGGVRGFASGPGGAPELDVDLRPRTDGSGYCADFGFAGLGTNTIPPVGIALDPAPVIPDFFGSSTPVDLDGDGIPDTGVRSVPGCAGEYGLEFYDLDPYAPETGLSIRGFTLGQPDIVLPELSDPTSRERDYLGASLVFNKRLANRWLLRGHLTYQDWEWGNQEPVVDLRLLDDPGGGNCYRIQIVLPDGRRLPGLGPGDAVQFDLPLPGGFLDPGQRQVPGCDPETPDLYFVPQFTVPSHLAGGQAPYGLDLRDILPGAGSFYAHGSGAADAGFPTVSLRDRGTGFFILGIDQPNDQPRVDLDGDGIPDAPADWEPIQLRVDLDGDGIPDAPFLDGADFMTVSPGISYGAFTVKPENGGGRLVPDPDAPDPDAIYLQDRIRLNDYFSLNLGVRADAFESAGGAAFRAPDASELFTSGTGLDFRLGGAYRSGGFSSSAGTPGLSYADLSLGGPILKDRWWVWGTYGLPDQQSIEDRFTYFTPGYYGSRLSPGALSFPGSAFTLGPIQSAPAGRGVQDVGLEISIPYDERYAPGGAAVPTLNQISAGEPLLYVVARGGSTGEVYDVVIVHPPEGRVAIDGVVVVEPVAATAADRQRFERELARAPGERETMTAAGYCLELDRRVPPPGTVYRVAPAAKQARYEPMRRALEAASRVRDAGDLDPDSDPTEYYHSIRQWAVWSVEKGFDRAGFLDAFTARTEENFREAGQPWSAEVADAVRAYGEGRWKDIREVLDAAEAAP